MGCMYSKRRDKHPGYQQSLILASETSFSLNEVEALHVLFKKLGSSIADDDLITKEEFQRALLGSCRQQNLFVDRVFNVFDLKRKGVIGFEEFVRSLSIFHPRTPYADKIAFAFNLYDLRSTGYIEREELREMVLAILQELDVILSDTLVEAMLDKAFSEADLNRDGKIDLEEWKETVSRNPTLLKNMTLPYLKELTTTFPSFLIDTQVHDFDLRAASSCTYISDGSKFCKDLSCQNVAYVLFSVVKD
ncbi:calcineurin B-like protein 7 [Silene latifolia]|uniref:calcineurin B-like protein 7 n=1 Tax=Silene latifolia TaxID=37657 RepID=UPI003D775110